MKKVLWTTTVLTLLLAACGNGDSTEADTPPLTEEPTEEVEPEEIDETEEEEAGYDPEDTMVGAITDVEPIPIEEYDSEKWTYYDSNSIGFRLASAVFAEDDRLYLGAEHDAVMALDTNFQPIWQVDAWGSGYAVDIAIDDTQIYNPSQKHVDIVAKDTGALNYQLDISEYEEMGEILIDDDAIYFTLAKMKDSDDTFPTDFSLNKFDKATGERLWTIDINGVRIGGGRSHSYVLHQNDELILLFEQTDDEVQRIVGRSKEDGTEVWSTEIDGPDRKDGARLGRIYHSNNALYTMDGFDMIHVFDDMTGEKLTEHPFNGYQPGGMVPLPILHDDLFIWQHGTEDYNHLKVVVPKTGEDLWVLDMDGHFLVDYEMVDDILYAFFGSLDYDAEENTLMARIDPYTGEILDLVDMGKSISAKQNNYVSTMGLTEHNGKLAYFLDYDLFIFNE